MADLLQGWGRGTWSSGEWGEFIPVEVTGTQSNTSVGSVTIVADAVVTPTGVSSSADLGQAIGEAESIYPLTGVQSNTATGTLEVQEGHGVQPTGVEMSFADGTETVITTVDAGWGRSTWSSFAWGENIEIFANLVGEQISTNIGSPTIITGTGETAEPTNVLATTFTGTLAMTGDALVEPSGLQVNIPLSNPTIIAGGSVTVSAAEDQMDFSIGTVNIDIFTQVDATAVTSTFDTGTLAMTGDSNLTLTGEESAAEVGTLVIEASSDVSVTGEQVDTETGVIATQTDNIIPVTGLPLQIQDGDPTVIANSTITPTGVSMQFADGTSTVEGNALVTPTGVEMSVILGNMRSTPWANVVTGASNTWTEVAA